MTRTHGVTHWDPRGCFGCKLQTLQFNDGPAPQTLMERRWDVDMPAYARLRADGLQPNHIDGSAELEAKLSFGQLECEMGHLFNDQFNVKHLPEVADRLEEAKSLEWSPVGGER